MIKVYMHEGKWRMSIEGETLQFNNKEEMEIETRHLIDIKEKYGKLNDKDRWDK